MRRREIEYSRDVFGRSRQCRSPTSSSQGSMQSNKGKLTPESESSQDSLPASLPAATARLRIKRESPSMDQLQSSCSSGPTKRPATDEPLDTKHRKRSERRQEPNLSADNRQHRTCRDDCPPINRCQRRESWQPPRGPKLSRAAVPPSSLLPFDNDANLIDRHDALLEKKSSAQLLVETSEHLIKKETARSDSGYQDGFADPNSQLIPQHSLHLSSRKRWAGITLQPEFSPISQEQLAAEVKGIYAGLVMVEAKCINIDAQKASHPHEELSTEQWQALVALHRTLLYEHHDFLMATQHPSANPALIGLAQKYSMPARMWKHGIHAFLEVLRHRRPNSQEYMLAFIYLAYQMMSLLLETVPGFTDTWIECLGDLARYRMAIEEDREIHTVWGGVAGRWYVKAADRHPSVGRLYHHSGILERPSLRKFYLYGRALTSVHPFLNARESLGTLCSPIVEDEHALRKGNKSFEALVICFHARVFVSQRAELVGQAYSASLTMLESQTKDNIAVFGVPLAVANISALLGSGSPDNIYRQHFDSALGQDILSSRPSQNHPSTFKLTSNSTSLQVNKAQRPVDFVLDFCYQSFNSIIRRTPPRESLPGLLPYIHVMLIFIKSLHTLRSRLSSDDNALDTLDDLLSPDRLDWAALARFLNYTARFFPISSRTESSASGETFPCDGVPLLEDYMIRGLVWAQWYFAPDWFSNIEDDDGSRCLEDDSKRQHRAARVLYLGMTLARESSHLCYDSRTREFSVAAAAEVDVDDLESTTLSPSSMSPRSGGDSSVEGDYVMVPGSSSSRASVSTYAPEAGSQNRVGFQQKNKQQQQRRQQKQQFMSSLRNQARAEARVGIVDQDEMGWE
jgi:hypothetical protein